MLVEACILEGLPNIFRPEMVPGLDDAPVEDVHKNRCVVDYDHFVGEASRPGRQLLGEKMPDVKGET